MQDLIGIDEVNRRLGLMLSGLDIRYDLGPGAGPRVPDYDLSDGTRLYQHLHHGRPVLIGDAEAPGIDRVDAPVEPLLVRPDGHIAWVASMGQAALTGWLEKNWRR
jgi:hypothetical protein